LIGFLASIVALIKETISVIVNTTDRIDAIKFDNTAFAEWLGYARYAMGDPLYILFTSVILISIGVTLWTYLLKGIGYIKTILPW
jgi:hypothetical protein